MEKDKIVVANIENGEVFFISEERLNKLKDSDKVKWTDDYGGVYVFDDKDIDHIKYNQHEKDGKYHILIFNKGAEDVYDIITKRDFEIVNNKILFGKLKKNPESFDVILRSDPYEVRNYGYYYTIVLPFNYTASKAKKCFEELYKLIIEFTFHSRRFAYTKIVHLLFFKHGIGIFKSLIDNSDYISKFIRENIFVLSSVDKIHHLFNTILSKGPVDSKIDDIINIMEKDVTSYGNSKNGFIKYYYKDYQIVLNETNKHISFFNKKGKFFYSIDLDDKSNEDLMIPLVLRLKRKYNDFVKYSIKTGIGPSKMNGRGDFYDFIDMKSGRIKRMSLTPMRFNTLFGMNVSFTSKFFRLYVSFVEDGQKNEKWVVSKSVVNDLYDFFKENFAKIY